MEWPILIIAGVCALMAVAIAFWVDRDNAKRRQRVLEEPPDRPVLADLPAPHYLTAESIRESAATTPADPGHAAVPTRTGAPHPRPDDASSHVGAAIADVTPLVGGMASPDFITDKERHRSVVEDPIVVVAEAVTTLNDLLPVIKRVQSQGSGLVVAAARVTDEVVHTLALNQLSRRLAVLVVATDHLDEIAAQTGATVLPAADLTAGYIPSDALGTCRLWVADAHNSWIVS